MAGAPDPEGADVFQSARLEGYFGQLQFEEHEPTGAPRPPRTTYLPRTTDGVTQHFASYYVMQFVLPDCWPCLGGIEDVLFLYYSSGSVSCDTEGTTTDSGWRGLDYPLGGYGGRGQVVPGAHGGATLSYEFFEHATDGEGLAVYDNCTWLPGMETWDCESGLWVPIERAAFTFTEPPETCDELAVLE